MTYTKGYPDVILGLWRGIQSNYQNTDDDSVFETKKSNGEWQYVTRIIKLGQILKAAGFKQGEIIGWSNPTNKPGFYTGKSKIYSNGKSSIIDSTCEMLSHDKTIGRSNVLPPIYSYRVKTPISAASHSPSSDEDPCNNLKENLTWLYGVKDNGRDAISFLLNPSSKELNSSNPVVKLSEGEIYSLRFRVVDVKSGGNDGCFVEINKGGRAKGSGWVFVFEDGNDRIQKGFLRLNGKFSYEEKLETTWYKPGVYNIAIIKYCRDGQLKLSINNQDVGLYIGTSGEQTIYGIAQGMDVVFDKN